jgi:hypothetical protein
VMCGHVGKDGLAEHGLELVPAPVLCPLLQK